MMILPATMWMTLVITKLMIIMLAIPLAIVVDDVVGVGGDHVQ